jgi:hypothetical protein
LALAIGAQAQPSERASERAFDRASAVADRAARALDPGARVDSASRADIGRGAAAPSDRAGRAITPPEPRADPPIVSEDARTNATDVAVDAHEKRRFRIEDITWTWDVVRHCWAPADDAGDAVALADADEIEAARRERCDPA